VARRPDAVVRRVSLSRGLSCPDNLLLVDDLVESGSTLSAAAESLGSIDALHIVGMAAVQIKH
jgi:hypoxanthine phosphoribosyltransferase